MINLRVQKVSEPVASASRSSAIATALKKALLPLRGSRVLDSQAEAALQQKAGEVEDHIMGAARSALGYTLERLESTTPKDTGETAEGWFGEERQIPDGVEFIIGHKNEKLVNMLNYGTKPHVIYPKNGKALKFNIGGKTVFAKRVMHPGTAGTGFVDRARDRLSAQVRALSTLRTD